MARETINIRLQSRVDTKENWANSNPNPVLLNQEIGYEKDTGSYKIGNGTDNWNALPYASVGLSQAEKDSIYKYKGTVNTHEALPTTNLKPGDVYKVLDTNMCYFWTGAQWEELGGGNSNSPGQPGLGDNSVMFASSTSTEEFDEDNLPTLEKIYYKPIIPELVEEKKNLEFSFSGDSYWGLYPTKIEFRDFNNDFSSDMLQIGNEYFLECEYIDENNNTVIKTDYFTVSNIAKDNDSLDVYIYGNYRYSYSEPEYTRVGFSLYSFFTATDFENLTFTTDENDTKLEKLYKYTDKWGNTRYTVFPEYAPAIADGTTTDLDGTILTSKVEEVVYDSNPMYKAIRYEAYFNSGNKFAVSAGKNSITTGENAVAVGEESIAMGDLTIALGRHNTAIGRQILTRGYNAVGLGYGSTVTGINAIAFNEAGKALGYASLTLGDHCIAAGAYAVAGGFQSVATKQGAMAIGHLSEATARHATAIGQVTKANGAYCVVTGNQNTCSGTAALVSGYGNEVTGNYNLVSGTSNTVSGKTNIVGGNLNTISSTDGLVAGANNTVEGNYSSAFGRNNTITGNTGLCVGIENTVGGQANFVAGITNEVTGLQSIVGGSTNKVYATNTIVSGNNNTLQAKEDNEGTLRSDNSIVCGSQNVLNGAPYSMITGNSHEVSQSNNMVGGYSHIVNGQSNMVGGNDNTIEGYNNLVAGANNTINGAQSFVVGQFNKTSNKYNYLLGRSLTATASDQTIIGSYNKERDDATFMIGIGTANSNRKNALTITTNGRAEFINDIELTTADSGIILKSPNGTKFKLTVDDNGTLTTEKVD